MPPVADATLPTVPPPGHSTTSQPSIDSGAGLEPSHVGSAPGATARGGGGRRREGSGRWAPQGEGGCRGCRLAVGAEGADAGTIAPPGSAVGTPHNLAPSLLLYVALFYALFATLVDLGNH